MLSIHNKIKIVATLLLKNEEDIIERNIAHHLSQGVTSFIVTLNNSTDKTKQIVEKFPEVVEIIEESDDTHNQSKWVTRMAQSACKFSPDWIIHLDADEFWCGLSKLKHINQALVGSDRMFLHPPVKRLEEFNAYAMRKYMNLENIPDLPGETKVAHRPNEIISIIHGNHGFDGEFGKIAWTKEIYRHHYPIRSYKQFERKTVDGHESLMRRNAPCPRWQKWYSKWKENCLPDYYSNLVETWEKYTEEPQFELLTKLLDFWSTQEAIEQIKKCKILPEVGSWN